MEFFLLTKKVRGHCLSSPPAVLALFNPIYDKIEKYDFLVEI